MLSDRNTVESGQGSLCLSKLSTMKSLLPKEFEIVEPILVEWFE